MAILLILISENYANILLSGPPNSIFALSGGTSERPQPFRIYSSWVHPLAAKPLSPGAVIGQIAYPTVCL